MQANSQKTYKITITSNRWMWSLESASVTIQNPQTGNSLTFDKWHKMDKLRTPSDWDIIARIGHTNESFLDLTVDEMKVLKAVHERENPKPVVSFSKTKSFAQRKFLASREADKQFKSGDCGCGGKMIIKNHGTWSGYYCTKCGGGGSRQNKKRY